MTDSTILIGHRNITVSLRIPNELITFIDNICDDYRMSRSDVIRHLLRLAKDSGLKDGTYLNEDNQMYSMFKL